MAEKSASFKKKQHFLQLINAVPKDKILFCPIDVSKHFHLALFHDIHCKPMSDFFDFSSSQVGFDRFISQLEAIISNFSPELVFIGCEPTSVYYEGLMQNLQLRYSQATSPRFQLCILDPLAVKQNRQQHSLQAKKSDFIDVAAIGELLVRGLYSPAYFLSSAWLRIKELSLSINDYRHHQLRLWNRTLTAIDRVFPNLLLNYKEEKPFCKKPLESSLFNDLLHIVPDPYQILSLSSQDLMERFHHQGRPLGPIKAEKILAAARRALLLDKPHQAVHLETLAHQLKTLDFLAQHIQSLTLKLCQLIPLTEARHLLNIHGNSEKLTADFLAALGDPQRYHSVGQIWAAAGLAPTFAQSGQKSSHPKISKAGSFHLRQAIYKLTATLVWHEPTFGLPCFERLLSNHAFVPTILHVGRKFVNTALAILHSDQPFQSPFEDFQQAKAKLLELQQQYHNQKKPKP
jgi:transposase